MASQPATALRRAATAAHHALRVRVEAVVVAQLGAGCERLQRDEHDAPLPVRCDRLHFAVGPAAPRGRSKAVH